MKKKDFYFYNLKALFSGRKFKGWGRKKTGRLAKWLYELFGGSVLFLEDGFIRSVGLGVNGSPSFSLIEDDMGIYYDATTTSKLESILSTYDFNCDEDLMATARKAIEFIKQYKISKYNDASLILPDYIQTNKKNILIIAQTLGDASLRYGLATDDSRIMILNALSAYPEAEVYVKVHPDVLAGKKESNVDIGFAQQHCKIITENVNPIVLLEVFDVVFTQTSQMGFEALLLGKQVHLYGLPFYAGWGLKNVKIEVKNKELDKVLMRRNRTLNVEEVFAGAYILYTRYYNPYKNKESDIIDTIEEIAIQRKIRLVK